MRSDSDPILEPGTHLRFKAELEDHLTPRDAERTLGAVIGWARYAELFGYDARLRRLKLGTG